MTATSTSTSPSQLTERHIKLTERHIKVLLVDDQRIVGETIRRMLLDSPGLEYRFCIDPRLAIAEAEAFDPTCILQDLIMPGVDGIEMVRAFRANAKTASTPLIVLSSKEEPTTKAEAFAAGANDYLVKLPDKLEVIARIRYHSAAYIHRLQRDEAFQVLEAQQRVIAQELAEAANYVRSLLPSPMANESLVPADWRFLTSSSLGGDSFGYHWFSPTQLAIYLLDVCGHGVGSALLSVSAINTVRNRTLRDTDFAVPSQVLTGLNRAFPMEEQSGKYFTMFYGIYDIETREIIYSSGGHPPAIAIAPDGAATHMKSNGMMIGAFHFAVFRDSVATLAPGSKLFVFSDGCYEVSSPAGLMMSLADFSQILIEVAPFPDALDRTLAATQLWQQRTDFEDDFSLLEFHL
jgi:sigma-B regulation protein RsbU (phosphoserine phosphatase)